MKQCSQCQRTYADLSLNFCLDDGTRLTSAALSSDPDAETLKFGTSYDTKPIAAPQPDTVGLEVIVQLQAGERQRFRNGEWAGTKGIKRGLEGFSLRIVPPVRDLSLRYRGHFQGAGDLGFVNEGEFLIPDEPRRLEGFNIELTGHAAEKYDICYLAHLEGWGDTRISKNGSFCGTQKESRRVEAIKVWITHHELGAANAY